MDARMQKRNRNPRQQTLKFASERARRIWLIENAVLVDQEIDEGARRVRVDHRAQKLMLRALLSYQRTNPACWPSQRELADYCGGWSVRKVQRVLGALKLAGVVLVETFWNPNTARRCNRYAVTWATLSDLAMEQFDPLPDDVNLGKHATAPDQHATAPDQHATVAFGNRNYKQELGNRNNGSRDNFDVLGLRVAKMAALYVDELRPVASWQHTVLRRACRAVIDGRLSPMELDAAVNETLAAARAGRIQTTRVQFFRGILEKNGAVL